MKRRLVSLYSYALMLLSPPSSSSPLRGVLCNTTPNNNTKSDEDVVLTTSVPEDLVYDVGKDILKRVLAKAGRSTITFEETSSEIDSFENISQIMETLPSRDVPEDLTSLTFITSFLAGGYNQAQSSEGTEFKTKVSWTQAACVCKNGNCTETISIDPVGFFDVANGQLLRGRAPLVFVDDDGELMPCLRQPYNLPPIEELELSGSCNRTANTDRLCANINTELVMFDGQAINLHKYRCVECSSENGIDDLRLFHNEKLVARSLNSSEMLPNERLFMQEPDVSLRSFFESLYIPPFLPPLLRELEGYITNVIFGIAYFIFDSLFSILFTFDFGADNSDKVASKATVAEITRVMESGFFAQFLQYLDLGTIDVISKVQSLPLYVAKQIERPEGSQVQEIISGIALLVLAACAFGALLGSSLRKNDQGKRFLTSIGGLVSITGGLFVLALEIAAFWLGWMGEKEHTEYSGALVHMEVKGIQRFSGSPFGSGDMKGAPFVVNTFVVELSDNGDEWGWLYILGMIFALLALVGSLIFSLKFEVNAEKQKVDEQKNKVSSNNSMRNDDEGSVINNTFIQAEDHEEEEEEAAVASNDDSNYEENHEITPANEEEKGPVAVVVSGTTQSTDV